MVYYLAIDIGASSGRHILGHLEDGKLCLEEVYRFKNEMINDGGRLCWDVENLFHEVKAGLCACARIGKHPISVAIDTWGVDYVLLDGEGREILPVYAYRDGRGAQGTREVSKILTQERLYSLTGIQKQDFNTIYQLYCDKICGRLEGAEHFLMIPDYLAYRLTGKLTNEYTNATTTNLVDARGHTWSTQILDAMGFPRRIFKPLSLPGDTIGTFTESVASEVGFNSIVICCPSHDTASAVAACPINDRSVYISSGTWSLIGTESYEPQLTRKARRANFTNEGGIEYRFRFLKNIMGMWLFQGVHRDIGDTLSYDEMMQVAGYSDFEEKIDPNDEMFVAPSSMLEAVRTYLGIPDLPIRDVLSSLYHSLAFSYSKAIADIERITNKQIDTVYIVGGGSRDEYLNILTSRYTGKKVITGAKEGTAVGNLLSQIMRNEGIDLDAAREIVKNTFETKEYF